MPDAFPAAYEAALRSQRWERVAPLLHDEACVTFSTGAVHRGKAEVQQAFEHNFAAIENDNFHISELVWRERTAERATYTFRFAWSGRVGGQPAAGAGVGTITLVRRIDGWRLLEETLHRAAP